MIWQIRRESLVNEGKDLCTNRDSSIKLIWGLKCTGGGGRGRRVRERG